MERGGCDRWVGRYIILGLLPHWMTAWSWGPRQQFKEPLPMALDLRCFRCTWFCGTLLPAGTRVACAMTSDLSMIKERKRGRMGGWKEEKWKRYHCFLVVGFKMKGYGNKNHIYHGDLVLQLVRLCIPFSFMLLPQSGMAFSQHLPFFFTWMFIWQKDKEDAYSWSGKCFWPSPWLELWKSGLELFKRSGQEFWAKKYCWVISQRNTHRHGLIPTKPW